MVTYKNAGVDIDAAARLVDRLKALAPDVGGFNGLYPLGNQYLVAGTDGVGTKLKIAFETNCHDTIGIDLVAMSVNDILTAGAKPLFFLDYFATSHLDTDTAEEVLKGIVSGCREAGCALLGGETAEMPGIYCKGEYDLAGFAVGVVDKADLIDGSTIQLGDCIVAIPSSGCHSNGFSLIRKIVERSGLPLSTVVGERSLAEHFLTPTQIYCSLILSLMENFEIKGMAHITGGGLLDNVPRMFPQGLGAEIKTESWAIPEIFNWLQEHGDVERNEMFRTFNMGIGYVLITSPEVAAELSDRFPTIGRVVHGKGVQLL